MTDPRDETRNAGDTGDINDTPATPAPADRAAGHAADHTADHTADLSAAGSGDERPELPAASAEELERLDKVRSHLLIIHRGLLHAERARYERVRGRIENNSAFLQLVINDPWFDWLRPMAQLVLLIDERTTDKKNPLGSAEARSLFDRARTLLKADAEGDAFQRLYFQALQQSPELAVLARQVAASQMAIAMGR